MLHHGLSSTQGHSSFTFSTGDLDSLREKLQTAEQQLSLYNSKNAQFIMQLSLTETRALQKMIEMTYLQGLSGSNVFPSLQGNENTKWSTGMKSGGNTGSPPSNYVCHKCGIEGHYVSDCPNVVGKGLPPGNYVCRKCNIQGHWIEDCPLGTQQDYTKPPPLGYCCHRCGVPGHWIKSCPTNESNGENPKERDKGREQKNTFNSRYDSKTNQQYPMRSSHGGDEFFNDGELNNLSDFNRNANYAKKKRYFNEIF